VIDAQLQRSTGLCRRPAVDRTALEKHIRQIATCRDAVKTFSTRIASVSRIGRCGSPKSPLRQKASPAIEPPPAPKPASNDSGLAQPAAETGGFATQNGQRDAGDKIKKALPLAYKLSRFQGQEAVSPLKADQDRQATENPQY